MKFGNNGEEKKTSYIIAWKNTHSGETGYVGKVSKDHFVNTQEPLQARKFVSYKAAENMVKNLIAIGEGKNNMFDIKAV